MRWLRLRAVWLLVIPFLWLARPTPGLLAAGVALAAVGLGIRGWAAGFIRKEKELTTDGPYAYTRNPLYVGSFLLGLGVTVAGGRWVFVALFVFFYLLVYGRTIRGEARLLEGLFGDSYRHYARHVPLLVPRLTPYQAPGAGAAGVGDEGAVAPGADAPGGNAEGAAAEGERGSFTLHRYRKNREYEAVLGTVAGFAFLAAKMVWM